MGLENTQCIDGNHDTARQVSLFEQISLKEKNEIFGLSNLKYRYNLQALSSVALFPVEKRECAKGDDREDPQKQYRELCNGFCEGLAQIDEEHRKSLPLWSVF